MELGDQSSIGGSLCSRSPWQRYDELSRAVPALIQGLKEKSCVEGAREAVYVRGGERASMGGSDRKARRNVRTRRATEDEDEEDGSKN